MPATPVPIRIDFSPASPHAGNTVTMTVTLDQATSSSTEYPLYCDHASLLSVTTAQGGNNRIPRGLVSGFPSSITVPANASTASLTLQVSSSAGRVDIIVAVGAPGADMSNPANWAAYNTLRVYP